MKRMTLILGAVLLPVVLGAASARADDLIDVSVNTAALQNQGAEVQFAMTDGSGLGDANNTVLLSNFALGGGTAGAVDPFYTTVASGDLGSGVSISDNTPSPGYSGFGQDFTAGMSLSFTLDATTNVDSGQVPDGFFMFITDPTGVTSLVTTGDPSGADSLFSIAFNGADPTVSNYDSALVSLSSPGSVAAAPELDPASAGAGVTFLAGLVTILRGRRRAGLRPAG